MKVGHATYNPYKIVFPEKIVHGEDGSYKWLGKPLLNSLINPSEKKVKMEVDKRKKESEVIIINCIDYLYGHSLLKLLNSEREHKENPEKGIVVIIQKALEWLVPIFVSEVWTKYSIFKCSKKFFPDLNNQIEIEINRFSKVYISQAFSHPSKFEIKNFLKVSSFDIKKNKEKRITFIWREDRLWINNYRISKALQKYPKLRKFFKPLV